MAEPKAVETCDDEEEKQPAGQITQAVAAVGKQRRRAGDKVSSAAMTIVTTAVVLTICYFAKPVLITLLVSILFAFLLEPIVNLFLRIRIPRPVGAVVALLLVGALLYGMTYAFYSKAVDFSQQLPQYTQKIRSHVMKFKERAQSIQKSAMPDTNEERQTVKVEQQTNWSEFITNTAGTLTELLFMTSFIPFLAYFMLTWHDHTKAATVMLFRMENRNTAYVTLGRISKMIRSFMVGNLVIALILSGLSMVVFYFIHLPYWYFLGVISGFLSVVPYLGVILAMVPPLVAGLGQGQVNGAVMLGIVLTVFGLHVLALNVLYPKLIGKRLQLNPLAVTISLLFWGWLWGAMGLILAVPITAAMKIIFDNVDAMRPYGAWIGE
jgi:predicted PurR-regulated permease PerM